MTIEVLIINTNDDNTATTIIGSLVVAVAIVNDVTWCIDVARNDTATIDIIDVVSSSTVNRNDTAATNIISSLAVTVEINNIARIHRPTVADNDGPTIMIRNNVPSSITIHSLDDASVVDGIHLVTVAIACGTFIRINDDALGVCDDDADSSIIGDTCITFGVVDGTCIDVSHCNCYFLLLWASYTPL